VDASDNPLELDRNRLAHVIDEARDQVLDHLDALDEQPAANVDDAEAIADTFRESKPPTEGRSFDELLDELFTEAIPASLNTPHLG